MSLIFDKIHVLTELASIQKWIISIIVIGQKKKLTRRLNLKVKSRSIMDCRKAMSIIRFYLFIRMSIIRSFMEFTTMWQKRVDELLLEH